MVIIKRSIHPMKPFFFTVVLCLTTLFGFPTASSYALTDSGITIGPYIQRLTARAATVLIRTDESETLACFYRKVGAQKWKSLTDSAASTTHRYRLTQLKKGISYEYYIGTADNRLTQTYTFHTKHTVTANDPLSVAVVGDFGELTANQLSVVTQMMAWQPDMLLTTGDNAYDSGTLDEFRVNLFNPYQPLLAELSVYPSLGNHDIETENGTPYISLFELPVKRSGTERYYSFKYDVARFIALDSNSDYVPGSAQYTWLENELAETDEQWTVVYFHHPPFSSGEHGSTSDMQDSLVPLFEEYDVDLVLSGHDHNYERNVKINDVVYVVTGGGGKSLREQENENPYSAVFQSDYHFVGLVMTGKELKLKAIDTRGFVFDSITLDSTDR